MCYMNSARSIRAITMWTITILIAATAITAENAYSQSQDYPKAQPIKMVSPFSAGGGGDSVARYFAQKMGGVLQQQIVVDARPGAGNIIATDMVAKAPPDGYTILLINDTHTINASFGQKLPYDTLKDFTPISLIAATPFVMVTHPSLPVNSVQELLKLARSKPGQMNYGSSGIGTGAHLSMALLNLLAKTDIVHVPYRGISGALLDLAAGRVQVMIVSPASGIPLVESHRLKALATTGAQRFRSLPNLPTIAEGGVPGYEFSSAYGFLAPGNTPRARIMILNSTILGLLKQPEVATWLQSVSADPAGDTPEAFQKYLLDRIAMYTKLSTELKLRIE